MFGLRTHPADVPGKSFDEHWIGLDHHPSACANRTEHVAWCARWDELGIAHGDIVDAHYGSGVSFRDPDGIALEFLRSTGRLSGIWPDSRSDPSSTSPAHGRADSEG